MLLTRGTLSFASFIILAGRLVAEEETAVKLLNPIREVDVHNQGQDAAENTWRALAKLDASQLPALLQSLDTASPLAANWIRSAIDAIAERTITSGGKLPKA